MNYKKNCLFMCDNFELCQKYVFFDVLAYALHDGNTWPSYRQTGPLSKSKQACFSCSEDTWEESTDPWCPWRPGDGRSIKVTEAVEKFTGQTQRRKTTSSIYSLEQKARYWPFSFPFWIDKSNNSHIKINTHFLLYTSLSNRTVLHSSNHFNIL